jgi:hypothetical protein
MLTHKYSLSTNFIKLALYLLGKYAIKEKSMADKQSALDATNAWKQKAEEGAAKNREYADKISAIDAKSPDAAAQLQAVKDERNAWRASFNPEFVSLQKTAQAEVDSLPTADKAEVQQTFDETKAVIRDQIIAPTTAAVNSARSGKEAEIKAAGESTTTNASESEAATKNKYENSEIVAASTTNQEATSGEAAANTGESASLDRPKSVPVGAIAPTPKPASVNFRSMAGDDINTDLRVKIRVPTNYLSELTQGPANELRNLKGIIFPYTPSISVEHKADYASQSPMHSNYAIHFYQRSSVSPINISGKFTVANESEAAIYIATIHLLRALTKMRSGGATGDADSGAPPPVCRLDAYGTFMLQNVPVAISNFKIDFPDNVDYYTLGKKTGSPTNLTYEMTAVPVVSTISVTCIPMYSRDEMQKFNVTQWLGSKYVRKAGYL